ncbi:hypothetical protein GCM10022276_05110 [Sphingomonas limnosediminicola]|uniref:DUF2336 domain-containing protein n=1 Tax=Sphingomonas limnosediminicola TaxID=940133 RepID=A0ABP7KWN5_9SPHN
MKPEEWPIAASAADQSGRARRAGRDRLSTVRVDFFLDSAERLTEQERALMTAMLHCMVADIADALRAALPNMATPANDEGNLAIFDRLSEAGLLDRAGLMRLLLRRADEERIATGAKSRAGRREARVVQGLVSHRDGAVAAAAMALIIARGRRRDRFGQCLLHFDDLPRDEARALVCSLAAALRADLVVGTGAAEADRQLAAAMAQVMASLDTGSSVENLTATLIRLLDEEDALSNELIGAAAIEGEINFVAQALARRCGLSGEVALEELLSADPRRIMAMLRMGNLAREVAGGLLAGIGDLLGISDLGRAIAEFDRLSDADVANARSWVAADPLYQYAVDSLGTDNGQRTV